MLKVIGEKPVSGEYKAVASGTLPNGKPVVVNADGTVSVVGSDTLTDSVGTATTFYEGTPAVVRAAFDSTNNKVLFTYVNQNDYLSVVVGTVNPSDNSITLGTPVIVASSTSTYPDIAFDPTTGKVVVVCGVNVGGIGYYQGTGYVGTVSGDSITFGSGTAYNAANTVFSSIIYDSGADRFVVCYKDQGNSNYGTAAVGALSGSTISWGSEYVWNSGNMSFCRMSYDTAAGKVVLAFRDNANSSYGTAIVGTVAPSTDTISFGSEYVFNAANSIYPDIAYDESAQKHVIAYQDSDTYGKAIVATVSGNTISYGSEVTFEAAESTYQSVVYDSNVNKTAIFYKDGGNSNRGTAIVGTISGTSISFGSPFVYTTADTIYIAGVFDSNSKRVAVGSRNNGGIGSAVASVVTVGGDYPNLTAENYIGMSRGAVSTFDKSYGSVATYSTNNTNYSSIAYDSNSNKIVIAYADDTDTTGKAVVGTVNSANNTISFGTPITFNSGTTEWISVVFDSNSNKIVISYRDSANSYYGTSIVGTVSGTSISFGTEVVFKSTFTEDTNMTFDTTANKVVLSYKVGVANTGNALVGTVSGTSISFGSEATFESGDPDTGADIVYDANANKTVIVYRDIGDSSQGKAVVGTVSGTSISFGTPVIYNTSGTSYSKVVYNSVDNNVIVAYRTASSGARARVGTVNGTTISFGDEATVASTSGVFYIGLGYNPQTNRIALAYGDTGNSNQGTIFEGTISGNTLSFDSGTIFNTNRTQWSAMAYDSTADRIVLNFEDFGDSGRGKAMVIETGGVTRGEVADGNPASLDIIGSVSDNQLSLTAGEKYYVQTDGTLGTTAGSPSVLAGTALSSTKLLVKT